MEIISISKIQVSLGYSESEHKWYVKATALINNTQQYSAVEYEEGHDAKPTARMVREWTKRLLVNTLSSC